MRKALFLLPHILGEEAKKVFNDAQCLLNEIISNESFEAVGQLSFFPAKSDTDDIHVYSDETCSKKIATFYGLRQQVRMIGIGHFSCCCIYLI